MRVWNRLLGFVALCCCLGTATSARGDFITIGMPDANYFAITKKIPVPEDNLTFITSLTDGLLTVGLAPRLQVRDVPQFWTTWSSPPFSESATPRVLSTDLTTTSLILTFSEPVTAFGFEVQPSRLGIFPVVAQFFDGMTEVGDIGLEVNGFGGARLMAAVTTTEQFTSVRISTAPDAFGFGIAQVRYGVVPEPATFTLLIVGGAGLLACGWRRRVRGTNESAHPS